MQESLETTSSPRIPFTGGPKSQLVTRVSWKIIFLKLILTKKGQGKIFRIENDATWSGEVIKKGLEDDDVEYEPYSDPKEGLNSKGENELGVLAYQNAKSLGPMPNGLYDRIFGRV